MSYQHIILSFLYQWKAFHGFVYTHGVLNCQRFYRKVIHVIACECGYVIFTWGSADQCRIHFYFPCGHSVVIGEIRKVHLPVLDKHLTAVLTQPNLDKMVTNVMVSLPSTNTHTQKCTLRWPSHQRLYPRAPATTTLLNCAHSAYLTKWTSLRAHGSTVNLQIPVVAHFLYAPNPV